MSDKDHKEKCHCPTCEHARIEIRMTRKAIERSKKKVGYIV